MLFLEKDESEFSKEDIPPPRDDEDDGKFDFFPYLLPSLLPSLLPETKEQDGIF